MADAVVVGAGIFGTSLAHRLALRGWRVVLVDPDAPGHVRAASGGESRLIRYAHGGDAWYTRSAWRARTLWRELEDEAGVSLLEPSGLVWLAHREHGWEAESERVLRAEGIPVERVPAADADGFFPDIAADDLAFVLHEPEAGILRAREAVRATFSVALAHGVRFVPGRAQPDGGAVVVGSERLSGDIVVWACGAWLPRLFGDLVPLRITKQDVFFFGASLAWQTPPVPGWVDYDGACYGLGDLDGRGVKLAPDVEGEPFDPESGPRTPSPAAYDGARAYLARRFPALADAPLVGTRTCQYALTPDTHFLLDRHPGHEHVWLFGGGSGHGFKHGPALGEYAASVVAGEVAADARFALRTRSEDSSLRTAGSLPAT